MGRTNVHGIRHKAKGGGKKWRPSPNDIILQPPVKPKVQTKWTDIRSVFKKKGEMIDGNRFTSRGGTAD